MTSTEPPNLGANGPDGSVVVGVVVCGREIRLLFMAETRDALNRRLAEYVASVAHTQLYPAEAARLLELIRAGEHSAAVDRYFESLEKRWDEEWLAVRTMRPVTRAGERLGWRSVSSPPDSVR